MFVTYQEFQPLRWIFIKAPPTMMNLADPELELLDPTPDVGAMFLHFDRTFFWGQLASRCVVRWSKRMYSCAGTCSYEGRGGLCDIALSEPLLKLRPRKDLVETLLHEMIHAYLFVTNRDQDRDGHGPNFQAHMHRINIAAGINITIYHDFHDEVKLYLTHWWRCNGPCRALRPHFGIVRRTNNRAPGPSDYWWQYHQRNCGGTFIKIKQPNKQEKKGKKTNVIKPNADITKYINNNNDKNASNKNIKQNDKPKKPVLKDTSNIVTKPNQGIKANSSSTLVVTKKNEIFNPQVPQSTPIVFNGTGHTVGKQPDNVERKRTMSNDVVETVRNVWANKQVSTDNTKQVSKVDNSTISNPNKHKPDSPTVSPPPKIKKIDDYFKTTATSVLKDLYGQDFNITQSKDDQKLKAVIKIRTNRKLVDCPVCNTKIDSEEINRHLDECLNKDLIEKLSKENTPAVKNESNVIVITEDGNTVPTCTCPENEIKKSPILTEKLPNTPKNVINKPKINLRIVIDVDGSRSRKSLDQVNITDQNNVNGPTAPNMKEKSPVSPPVQIEPSCSYTEIKKETECPCCGEKLKKSVDEHLDECLSFFKNNNTIPEEGTIIIDDDFDDEFDESQKFNNTGTKLPCPCCLMMIEFADMSQHLVDCLVPSN